LVHSKSLCSRQGQVLQFNDRQFFAWGSQPVLLGSDVLTVPLPPLLRFLAYFPSLSPTSTACNSTSLTPPGGFLNIPLMPSSAAVAVLQSLGSFIVSGVGSYFLHQKLHPHYTTPQHRFGCAFFLGLFHCHPPPQAGLPPPFPRDPLPPPSCLNKMVLRTFVEATFFFLSLLPRLCRASPLFLNNPSRRICFFPTPMPRVLPFRPLSFSRVILRGHPSFLPVFERVSLFFSVGRIFFIVRARFICLCAGWLGLFLDLPPQKPSRVVCEFEQSLSYHLALPTSRLCIDPTTACLSIFRLNSPAHFSKTRCHTLGGCGCCGSPSSEV